MKHPHPAALPGDGAGGGCSPAPAPTPRWGAPAWASPGTGTRPARPAPSRPAGTAACRCCAAGPAASCTQNTAGGKSRVREGECQPLASCTPIKQPLGEARRGCERGSAPWGHAGAYLVAPHPVARVHDERFPTVVVLTDIQAAFGALIFNLQGEKKIIIIRTGRADGATLGAGVAGHLNIAVQTRCWHRCQVRVPRPFQDTRNARGSASSPRLRARAARPKFQEIEADLNPGGSQRRALGGHVTTLSFPAAGPTSPRNYTHTHTDHRVPAWGRGFLAAPSLQAGPVPHVLPVPLCLVSWHRSFIFLGSTCQCPELMAWVRKTFSWGNFQLFCLI